MQTLLIISFSLTALSVAYVSYDLMVRTPEMKVMKWGWVMVTLYTGIVGLIVYVLSCREPAPGTHEKFVAPLWKQTVGSTIHCMAGDATGVIVVAFITALLNLPMGADSVLEYIAGFAFGLFVFQALFMKDMLGGSYKEAVRKTWYPEWISMNFVMAGMIPVMMILMTRDMQNMDVRSLRFWGIMSLASLIGGVLAIPVNWWLVKNKLKHGMGTERALGNGGAKEYAGPKVIKMVQPYVRIGKKNSLEKADENMGHTKMNYPSSSDAGKRMEKRNSSEGDKPGMNMQNLVSKQKKILIAILSIVVLAVGIAAAAYWGDFSMRPNDMMNTMEMKK